MIYYKPKFKTMIIFMQQNRPEGSTRTILLSSHINCSPYYKQSSQLLIHCQTNTKSINTAFFYFVPIISNFLKQVYKIQKKFRVHKGYNNIPIQSNKVGFGWVECTQASPLPQRQRSSFQQTLCSNKQTKIVQGNIKKKQKRTESQTKYQRQLDKLS